MRDTSDLQSQAQTLVTTQVTLQTFSSTVQEDVAKANALHEATQAEYNATRLEGRTRVAVQLGQQSAQKFGRKRIGVGVTVRTIN